MKGLTTEMQVTEEIETRLKSAFAPAELSVQDDSEAHRGHSGWREGGETHFRVHISSGEFTGMTRIDRERAVHAALGPDLIGRIHALTLKIEAP